MGRFGTPEKGVTGGVASRPGVLEAPRLGRLRFRSCQTQAKFSRFLYTSLHTFITVPKQLTVKHLRRDKGVRFRARCPKMSRFVPLGEKMFFGWIGAGSTPVTPPRSYRYQAGCGFSPDPAIPPFRSTNLASRREFLADVGKGMMLASIGPALSSDLGLSRGFAAEGSETLNFGKLEPLVAFLQDTPTNKLMAETIKKLKDGTDLRTLVAAGALGERQIQIYPFRVSWTRRASRRKPDVDSRTPNFGRYHVGLTPRRSPGRCLGKFVPAARLNEPEFKAEAPARLI